jgi:hypothetical protein
VGLPFTPDQFLGVFADYNRDLWLVAAVLWLATLTAVVLVWREPERWSPAASFFAAALWLWNAVAYHALLFTRINPAAWLFAALFAVQAALFVRAGLRRRIVYFSSSGATLALGAGLAAYSMVYPLLSMTVVHGYPATPTFGVPCPTAILTIGLFLTVRGGAPTGLALIPIAWSFIGGSAAVLLAVRTDVVLLGAGALLAILLGVNRPRGVAAAN